MPYKVKYHVRYTDIHAEVELDTARDAYDFRRGIRYLCSHTEVKRFEPRKAIDLTTPTGKFFESLLNDKGE